MKEDAYLEKITLDSIENGARGIEKDHLYSINRNTLLVASLMMIIVDSVWVVLDIMDRTFHLSTLSYIGMIIEFVYPALTLIYLFEMRSLRRMKSVVFSFHILTIISAVIMNMAHVASNGFTKGIPLSLFWLVICVFLPMSGILESAIVMSLLFVCTFVPQMLVFGISFHLLNNIIFAVCIVAGYFAFRDIAVRSSRLVRSLALTSYTDHQTGTMNRRALVEYLSEIGNKDVENIGVMVYDIDDFKAYNDEYSHQLGDIILSSITETVTTMLHEEGAKAFRYSGSEFVAVMENVDEEYLLKVALKIKSLVEDLHLERRDNTLRDYVTVTIGVTYASRSDCREKDILGDAETQLFIGKKGTKDCVVYKGRIYIAEGEISMEQQPSLYTERVTAAVSEAMKRGEMKAYFQPLYETSTQKLVGAEALSRWQKPDGTLVLPSEYVPELEKNSSILSLDWFMFEEACRVLRREKDMGLPQVKVAVNFSRMHILYERNIEKRLSEIADTYAIPHELIEIEITESAYIHIPSIIEPIIRDIRNAGFAVAVDDFGSGASSLEFIKSVDVDTLKIDKSLISSNCSDEKEKVLLESVVMLAHRLQLNSVAEGVETIEQLGFLKTLGVKLIQGFIFSMPLPEDDYLELLKNEGVGEREPLFSGSDGPRFSSVQMLLDTVFKEYPIVIISNLTRKSYYTMTYESFTNHSYPQAGELSELLADIRSTLEDECKDEFDRLFDLNRQVQAYKDGVAKFSFTARIHGDKDSSDVKTLETTSYYVKEKGSADLLVITLCNEITPAR